MLRLWLVIASVVTSSAAALAGSGGVDGSPTAVPEPASLAVLGVGAGAVMLYRHLRK